MSIIKLPRAEGQFWFPSLRKKENYSNPSKDPRSRLGLISGAKLRQPKRFAIFRRGLGGARAGTLARVRSSFRIAISFPRDRHNYGSISVL